MSIPLGITSFPSYGSALTPVPNSSNRACDLLDKAAGLNLSPTPAQLCRAIYIPHHTSHTTHLALYNVSKAYEAAIGDAPVGGSEFKMRLCLMRKPSTNAVDADVRFLVNVEQASGRATVEERTMGGGAEAFVVLPSIENEYFPMGSSTNDLEYLVGSTYPLPETHGKKETIRYPFFSIMSTNEKNSLEWQVRLDTLGKLGYVLIDTTIELDEPSVLAIYHHAGGIEPEMPNTYSEGMLLLTENLDNLDDTIIIASLFGLLWKIRAMRGAGEAKKTRKTIAEFFQKMHAKERTKLPSTFT